MDAMDAAPASSSLTANEESKVSAPSTSSSQASAPERDAAKLSVFCLTFNTATCRPPEDADELRRLLVKPGDDARPDLYVLGFQEVHSRLDKYFWDTFVSGQDEWSQAVSGILCSNGDYTLLRSVRVLGVVLDVFCRTPHLTAVREIETSFLRLSMGGYVGLKGAVAFRMKLWGVSLCFVNAHLSAHDHQLELRLQEYDNIVENLTFQQEETTNILYHDYVVWMGDLNFRLEEGSFTFEEIDQHVRKKELKLLLERDQLSLARQEGRAFHELTEAQPEFAPTYKFKIGFDEYDAKRRPAWTDRVLHRCNTYNYDDFPLELTHLNYDAHFDCRVSDHKPVTSQLEMRYFDKMSANARSIPAYEPIVFFRTPDDWHVGQDGRVNYHVQLGQSGYLTTWDWVALFKANFTSLEDYVTFTWASPCRRTGMEKEVVILDSALNLPGKFRLVYFGRKNCVLGVSQPFSVTYPSNYFGPVEIAEEAAAVQ